MTQSVLDEIDLGLFSGVRTFTEYHPLCPTSFPTTDEYQPLAKKCIKTNLK